MSFKKSLRNSNFAQSTFEYVILLAIFMLLALVSANTFIPKVSEIGEDVFQQGVERILGYGSN